ncbi:hypothetical protein C2S51_035634 [Perilla frutescens var. frutescens]|nr:hypothetical protein C2S51_035634 [Perilla frutescens var. frutescens]
MGENLTYLFLLMMMICVSCNANEIHKVGGSSGWTSANLTPSYYKSWATSKVFNVGDTILFEYNKEFHDVVRVTHKNFNACNSTAPYAKWATGNDSFTIRRPGHYYFICGVPGHCWTGQKVDIRVPQQGPVHSPSPSVPYPQSPPEAGQSSPPTISSSPALPPKKNAAASINSYLKPWLLAAAICILGI